MRPIKVKNLSSEDKPINMGHEAEFEILYRSYFAPLCFFAQKYIGAADAEDVVNTLFLKLWRQKKVFTHDAHAQATLYKATRNACLNHLKMSKRAEDRHKAILAESAEGENAFIYEMIRTEVWAEIYREIHKLPSQCARVINLSFRDGLKNDEIAKTLGLSVQTVKNQKGMGLKILKQRLSKSTFLLLSTFFLKIF